MGKKHKGAWWGPKTQIIESIDSWLGSHGYPWSMDREPTCIDELEQMHTYDTSIFDLARRTGIFS